MAFPPPPKKPASAASDRLPSKAKSDRLTVEKAEPKGTEPMEKPAAPPKKGFQHSIKTHDQYPKVHPAP